MDNLLFFGVAVLVSSFVSGFTGMGGGILLMASMASFIPPLVLIPLHGSIQLLSNMSRVFLSVKKINVKIFVLFATGAALGAILSYPINLNLDSLVSTLFIASAIILFTWIPKIQRGVEFRGKFFAIGAVASFLSVFVGATGPLTAPFFINSELDKESFVPTKAACQIPIHLFKVILYLFSGFILAEWALYILLAVPLVMIGAYTGKLLTGKIEEGKYNLLIKIVITLLVGRMLVKAFL